MGLVTHLRATGSYYAARFHKGEEGAVATEYGFLIVFIAIAVALGAFVLGGALQSLFTDTGGTINVGDQVIPGAPGVEAPAD